MKWLNLALVLLLVLLVRKLLWCLRWLWCWKKGRALPPPISFLPCRSGELFASHVDREREQE